MEMYLVLLGIVRYTYLHGNWDFISICLPHNRNCRDVYQKHHIPTPSSLVHFLASAVTVRTGLVKLALYYVFNVTAEHIWQAETKFNL